MRRRGALARVVMLLVLGCYGATLSAAEVEYRWRPVKVGAGGFITGIDLPPGGSTRYIRTDTYGAYRWDGSAWQQLVNARSMPPDERRTERFEGVQALASAPSDPNRVYLLDGGRVFRSSDGGGAWSLTAFAPVAGSAGDNWRTQGNKIAVDPRNADVVYVGTSQDGLWRSLDGGASWQRAVDVPAGQDVTLSGTTRGPGVNGILFVPGAPALGNRTAALVVGSWLNGIYRSSDAGQSFQRIAAGGSAEPQGIVRASFGPDAALYVVDGRALWKLPAGGSWLRVLDHGGLVAVAADPQRAGHVVAAEGGGRLFRSLDGGGQWSAPQTPLRDVTGDIPWHGFTEEGYFTTAQLAFDPLIAQKLWITQRIGVWHTQVPLGALSGSVVWRGESRGIEQLVGNDVLALPGGRAVLAAWDRALFLSVDPGAYPTGHGSTARFNSAWSLDSTPALPGFVVANVSDHRFCCEGDGRSSQAGFSVDGGQSWQVFETQPGPSASQFGFGAIAVAADSADNLVWLPTSDRGLKYSLDRGRTWADGTLEGFGSGPTGSHFALFLNRKVLAADRVLAGTFYLAHAGRQGAGEPAAAATRGLWRSTNRGATWQRVYTQELAPYSVFNATLKAVPGRAGQLFFTSGPLDGFDAPFRRSLDGGQSWQDVAGVTRVLAFGFGAPRPGQTEPTLYFAGKVGGDYGLWRSQSGYAGWDRIGVFPADSLDRVQALSGDPENFGRVYLAWAGSGFAVGEPAPLPPQVFANGFE